MRIFVCRKYAIIAYTMFMLLFFIMGTASAQADKIFDHINNRTVSFDVRCVGAKIKNGIAIPAKYFVIVKKQENDTLFLKGLTANDWMAALADPSTDWAANLLLYDIYNKSNLLYYTTIDSRERWISTNRKKDLAYWEEKFVNFKSKK